jgi:hypothetical protein
MYDNLKKLKMKGGIVMQIFHKLKDFKRMILVLFSFLLVVNIISFCFVLPEMNNDKLVNGSWCLYPYDQNNQVSLDFYSDNVIVGSPFSVSKYKLAGSNCVYISDLNNGDKWMKFQIGFSSGNLCTFPEVFKILVGGLPFNNGIYIHHEEHAYDLF